MRWFLVVLFAGCTTADARLPDQLIEGKHVRYHYWADAGAPCPEAIEEMDRYLELLGKKLNRPAPADFQVDYYRLTDLDAVHQFCIRQAAACAVENKVYSTEWTHDHELAHAFLYRFGYPPGLFREGTATMLGCGPARWSGAPLKEIDLAPLLDEDAWSQQLKEENYAPAASFARWLVERRGIDTFITFYESTSYTQTQQEVSDRFRAVFGLGLSDALAEWKATQPARDGEFCLPVEDRCDGAADLQINAAGESQMLSAPVSCVNHVSVLEIGDVPVTRVRFTASQPDRILKLRPCDSTAGPSLQLNHTFYGAGTTNLMDGRWQDFWSTLKRGRYSLTIENVGPSFPRNVISPPGGNLSILVEGRGPVLGESCAVEPIPVPDDSWAVRFSLESSGLDAGVIRLEPVSDRRIVLFAGRGFEAPASLCEGCAGATSCTAVSAGASYPGWLRGPTSLQLTPNEDEAISVHLFLQAP